MNNVVQRATLLTSYLTQSPEVRARFDRLKAREEILNVRNLTKIFKAATHATTALNNINFTTHRREFLWSSDPPAAESRHSCAFWRV